MGVTTRTLAYRLAALVLLIGTVVAINGCGTQEPAASKGSSQKFDIDNVRPASPTQDPNKVPVEKPKPELPRQLFNRLDRNGDGLIDEDEMRAGYQCTDGFCPQDKELVKALYENRATIGHVRETKTISRPVSTTVSVGETGVQFTSHLRYHGDHFAVSLAEFERFVQERQSAVK